MYTWDDKAKKLVKSDSVVGSNAPYKADDANVKASSDTKDKASEKPATTSESKKAGR